MFARIMGLQSISPADLHRRMQQDEPLTIVDVTARSRWATGHVPGAANLDPAEYGEGELPKDKEAELVFYCSGAMCRKAPSAARRARKMGYAHVRVMSAGISGWLAAKLPTELEGPGR